MFLSLLIIPDSPISDPVTFVPLCINISARPLMLMPPMPTMWMVIFQVQMKSDFSLIHAPVQICQIDYISADRIDTRSLGKYSSKKENICNYFFKIYK